MQGTEDSTLEHLFDTICRTSCSLFSVPWAVIHVHQEGPATAGNGLDVWRAAIEPLFREKPAKEIEVVEDATRDSRFAALPAVADSSRIGFYAGAPLFLEPDDPVGVLCLLDASPRAFTLEERRQLEELARVVSAQLQMQATARKASRQESLFRLLAENSTDTLVRGNMEGVRLYISPAVRTLLGYEPEELVGKTARDIVHPDDVEEFARMMQDIREARVEVAATEHRQLHKNGSWIWMEALIKLTRDEATGQPTGYVVSVRDISRRKQAEQESARRLRDMQRLTETANQLLRAFETGEDEVVFVEVLRIALAAFESKAGLFLRFDPDGLLVGPCLGADAGHNPRCAPDSCDLWSRVLHQRRVIAENSPRTMRCGLTVARSLAGPILYDDQVLGVMHLGDAGADYTQSECDLLTLVLQLTAPALYARMRLSALTNREVQVMDLIVMGLSQKQIATVLDISVQTVAKHRARVLEKLEVRGDVDLVYFALKKRSNRLFDPTMISLQGDTAQDMVGPPICQDDRVSFRH